MPSKSHHSDEMDFEYFGTDDKPTIVAALTALCVVSIWLLSLLSPLILAISILNKYYFFSLLIILICIIAYLPSSFDLKSLSFRAFIFDAVAKYYHDSSMRWIKGSQPYSQQDIDNNVNGAIPTLFCAHPHGIVNQGCAWLSQAPQTIEATLLMSNTLYASPFFRLFSRCVTSASGVDKISMQNVMKSKKNCIIAPGGFHEATVHSDKTDRVYLKNRKGFIKYAIQFGYSVTPVFSFGEKDTFYNVPGWFKFRLWLNNFGIPGVLPFGRWICPIVPRNKRLHVVIDAPLLPPKLKKNETITREMVDEHHRKYTKKLKALYQKYAKVYYQKESRLEIW